MKHFCFLCALLTVTAQTMRAEDGSRLWLRAAANVRPARVRVDFGTQSDAAHTLDIAASELRTYWHGAQSVTLCHTADTATLGRDGFRITLHGRRVRLEAPTPVAALYGAYHLLRLQATRQADSVLAAGVTSRPANDLRVLNHWDNPDGTIERGYAGHSIFWGCPLDTARLRAYGRACASIGINRTVLNNVNAKPEMLRADLLDRTRAIADILRPYGLRVMLSVNFGSPHALGGLGTADPADERVKAWWAAKSGEIYGLIPDFGGYLVKANSEGEPGPMDYGRTHAEGANMLAASLRPWHGVVMWRAFVYSAQSADRAAQAYDEFMPLDGQFADNVIVQIKNGPIDFQPHEPVSPLLLAMRRTHVMTEVQITQEYLGHSIHTVLLAPEWSACADLCRRYGVPQSVRAVAGVSNVGDTLNWTGNDLSQANWYAFGRLAWNPGLATRDIAAEFLAQAFTPDPAFVRPMTDVLARSHDAAVHYMMPLGLHHIFAGGHHYGPEPWYVVAGCREDWLPRYYHRADTVGLGFDRGTAAPGSGAIAQYPAALREQYASDESLILWFHHVPWSQRLSGGETLWEALCRAYGDGVAAARGFAGTWAKMRPWVDAERWSAQQRRFDRQAEDAVWWRDACLLYFQQFSRMPLPSGVPAAGHNLPALMRFHLNIDNYTCAPIDALP